MRKIIIVPIVFLFLVLLATSSAVAAEPIKIKVNGLTIMPDVAPIEVNGRTMVPVRFIAEALGTTVNWDDKTSTVIIGCGQPAQNDTGQIRIMVNGQLISPDVPPKFINNRVMVPVRFVAEALNCRVGWYNYLNTVTITGLEYTTAHTNILPANGVSQTEIDTIKDYAEKVYQIVGSDLKPPQGVIYDIYLYRDRDSFANGEIELRRISRNQVTTGQCFWQWPNIIGLDISNLGPDTGNEIAFGMAELNCYIMAGNNNKVPYWLGNGLGYYELFSMTFNSMLTSKNIGLYRQSALDALATGSLKQFNGISDPKQSSYGYAYANYMAAKFLIDRIGFPKINDLLSALNSNCDWTSTFLNMTGLSIDDIDYQTRKALQTDSQKILQPLQVKVGLTDKGCCPDTKIVIATKFTGQTKFYYLKPGQAPGDYYFTVNPDGSVNCGSGSLTELPALNFVISVKTDVAIIILDPCQGTDNEQFAFNVSHGAFYPTLEAVFTDNEKDSADLSNVLGCPFPDGNTVSAVDTVAVKSIK